MRKVILLTSTALLTLFAAGKAGADGYNLNNTDIEARINVVPRLQVSNYESLDFGTVMVMRDGEASITMDLSGGLDSDGIVSIGDEHHLGEVRIEGPATFSTSAISFSFPQDMTLETSRGEDCGYVTSFSHSSPNGIGARNGYETIFFGGTFTHREADHPGTGECSATATLSAIYND